MMITHKLEMDFQDRNTMPRIHAVQGDADTRMLELTLRSAGAAWNVPEDARVLVRYCKSDGTKGAYDTLPDGNSAWYAEEDCLRIVLAPQMLTAEGLVLMQVELIQGTAILSTFSLQITVEQNVAQGMPESEDYLSMLQWMRGELDRMLEEARDSGEFTGGPCVYQYARDAGYTGTEVEFKNQLITPCLPVFGGTMTGELNMGGLHIQNLGTPRMEMDAANKAYVDGRRITFATTLHVDDWSKTQPYRMNISLPGTQSGGWIRMQPQYTFNQEMDLALKRAFDCISYVKVIQQEAVAVCLESKPEINLQVFVEVVGGEA